MPAAPPVSASAPVSARLAACAWVVLGLNLLVVLWGAFVRASGSGAGCGSHWPLCNGVVLPQAPTTHTLIEFTHRLTSGIALISVVVLVVWSFRASARRHPVRLAALGSLFFILTEAALGAGLVLFNYVTTNASGARAAFLSAHLVNTLLLLATISLTGWLASGGALPSERYDALAWTLLAALAGTIILGVTGAIAALGDTLYPAASVAAGIKQDLSSASSVLLRLRVLHPFLAIAVGIAIIAAAWLASAHCAGELTRRLSSAVIVLVVAQLAAGLLNLLLLAPVWMQIIHLLLADLLWIALVLLTLSALAPHPGRTRA
ncbi:MAG: COX15/CtaA family protein [Bryobacteraceae bacterium]